jgi:restriction system protein
MARRARSPSGSSKSNELAAKLIGAGLLLGLLPLILGKSAILAAFRPIVPLGWGLVVVGIAMLMWRREGSKPKASSPPVLPSAAQRPVRLAPDASMTADKMSAAMNKLLPQAEQNGHPTPQAPKAWGKEVFDQIEWRRFEALVEVLFSQAGFETKSQSHGADEGIDIWLYSRNNPSSPVSVVQCKHWQGKKVGVDKVRELRGVMAAKNVSRGQFATTSTFTDEAVAFAKNNGVNLLDVQGLLELISQRTQDQQAALLSVALEGEYWRPTCVNCGIKMVERTSRNDGSAFWGCCSDQK